MEGWRNRDGRELERDGATEGGTAQDAGREGAREGGWKERWMDGGGVRRSEESTERSIDERAEERCSASGVEGWHASLWSNRGLFMVNHTFTIIHQETQLDKCVYQHWISDWAWL